MEGRFVMNSPRSLPLRADLEHLRNQAKQRLKAMRVQDPAARLTYAQVAIAREYGFASWRQLKATVDARDRGGAFAAAYEGVVYTLRRVIYVVFMTGATDAIV